MKYGIELNALANLHILIDDLQGGPAVEFFNKPIIKEQLVLLERYMIAFNKAVNEEIQAPSWHEVRETPSMYPTNREPQE